jgi:hypothetical protein
MIETRALVYKVVPQAVQYGYTLNNALRIVHKDVSCGSGLRRSR